MSNSSSCSIAHAGRCLICLTSASSGPGHAHPMRPAVVGGAAVWCCPAKPDRPLLTIGGRVLRPLPDVRLRRPSPRPVERSTAACRAMAGSRPPIRPAPGRRRPAPQTGAHGILSHSRSGSSRSRTARDGDGHAGVHTERPGDFGRERPAGTSPPAAAGRTEASRARLGRRRTADPPPLAPAAEPGRNASPPGRMAGRRAGDAPDGGDHGQNGGESGYRAAEAGLPARRVDGTPPDRDALLPGEARHRTGTVVPAGGGRGEAHRILRFMLR